MLIRTAAVLAALVLTTVTPIMAADTGAAAAGAAVLKKGDRIVFLGDSITAGAVRPDGFITLIKGALDAHAKDLGVETLGAGISGNKVPDLQKRLQKDVLDKKPTIVFIYIGINDVWHWKKQADGTMKGGTPKDAYEAGLKDIIGKMKAAGARVVLCTPSVIGEKADGSNERDPMLEEYAAISRNVAKDCGVELLDLRKVFIDYEKANNKGNQPKGILTGDGVHLNKEGNKLVAEAMLKVLGVAPALGGMGPGLRSAGRSAGGQEKNARQGCNAHQAPFHADSAADAAPRHTLKPRAGAPGYAQTDVRGLGQGAARKKTPGPPAAGVVHPPAGLEPLVYQTVGHKSCAGGLADPARPDFALDHANAFCY